MSNYQAVVGKYGENATVWIITFHDGTGWEQEVYVITPNMEFAREVARALTTFDKPRFRDASSILLHKLRSSEIEAFIGPTGQPQNIAVFDAEPEE